MINQLLNSIPSEIWEALYQFLGSMIFLIVIIIISVWKKVEMEKTFIIATLRGFSQILILASVLTFVFQLSGILPLLAVLLIMVVFGAQTAADRIENIENVFFIELIALFISVYIVMVSMTLIKVLPSDNLAFAIPIGGMVTGNSMNISYLTLDRIQSEVCQRKTEIEAALCLGASAEQSLQKLKIIPSALKVGITPTTNNLKTLGLVFIPGLMTGLLIGGLHPIAAALLQVMIFFLIFGGGFLAALIASLLVTGNIFDMEHMALPVGFGQSKE